MAWSEERKKVERVILELVRLSQEKRHEENHVAANAYNRAIRILSRECGGDFGVIPESASGPDLSA